MILLLQSYSEPQNYDEGDGVYGTRWRQDVYYFNEATQTVEHGVSTYDSFRDQNPPYEYEFSFEGEFYGRCEGTTRQSYQHDGFGGFTVTPQPDSLSCGFVPPAPLTCDLTLAYELTLTATGADLLAQASAAHGAVQYRLDGSTPQLSPRFYDLAPGKHVLTALDSGISNCARSVDVVVAEPPPPAVPAGPPAGIDLAWQPIWYPVSAPVAAQVVLQLYAESRHGLADYALVLTLRRQADKLGRVNFRLDQLLAPLLSAFVPPATAGTVSRRCTTQLLNYFVRTAVVPAPGRPAVFNTSPLRTVLRGALPAELRDLDYFAYRLSGGLAQFLTWQPAGKEITPQQPEWLFWLAPPNVPATLEVRRQYSAPDLVDPVTETEVVDVADGHLLAIPVGVYGVGGTVRVSLHTQGGQVLSPEARFEVVAPTGRSRYVLFTNSLGGLDTLRTEGRLEATLEAAAERAELPALPPGSGAGPAPVAERLAFDVSAQRKLKLATGWLTAAELRWLQELMLSREAWEWQPASGRLLPLDLTKRQLLFESDTDALRGVVLEFDYAFAPGAYASLR